MRASAFFLFATLAACGGSTATIPSASNDPSGGEGSGTATPTAPPPAAVAPPPATTTPPPACGESGAPTVFASVSQQRAALGAAWDACTNGICPDAEPHLLFSRDGNFAACGHWCGSDGGFCEPKDPHLRFTYTVSATADGYVLDLANQTDADPRTFTIRYWIGSPSSSMELTDQASMVVTTLQTVGVPVK